MPPKKAAAAGAPKKTGSSHASYRGMFALDPRPQPRRVAIRVVSFGSRVNADSFHIDMIKDAIINVS